MLNLNFVTLAGNPTRWDEEFKALPDRDQSLVRLQERQSREGYIPAILVESIYGWYVRYASGLQGFGILLHDKGLSRPEAIAWGVTWANQDPNDREFYARKSDLESLDKWAK